MDKSIGLSGQAVPLLVRRDNEILFKNSLKQYNNNNVNKDKYNDFQSNN